MRAIHMYCDLVSGTVLDGLQAELTASGIDIGARAVLPAETVADELAEDELPGEAVPAELDEAETADDAATAEEAQPTAH